MPAVKGYQRLSVSNSFDDKELKVLKVMRNHVMRCPDLRSLAKHKDFVRLTKKLQRMDQKILYMIIEREAKNG